MRHREGGLKCQEVWECSEVHRNAAKHVGVQQSAQESGEACGKAAMRVQESTGKRDAECGNLEMHRSVKSTK